MPHGPFKTRTQIINQRRVFFLCLCKNARRGSLTFRNKTSEPVRDRRKETDSRKNGDTKGDTQKDNKYTVLKVLHF